MMPRWLLLAGLLVLPLGAPPDRQSAVIARVHTSTAQLTRGAAARPRLGPAPHQCRALSPRVGGRARADTSRSVRDHSIVPLRGFLFTEPHPVLTWGVMADAPGVYQLPYGWGHKVLWTLTPGFTGTVTLRGLSLDGRAALWLDATENSVPDVPVRVLPLNPGWQRAFSPGEQGPSFPGDVYIPRAGCYALLAQWSGGQWRGIVAAGR